MEDSHIAVLGLENGNSLFGVFDGHGGKTIDSLENNIGNLFFVNNSRLRGRPLCEEALRKGTRQAAKLQE